MGFSGDLHFLKKSDYFALFKNAILRACFFHIFCSISDQKAGRGSIPFGTSKFGRGREPAAEPAANPYWSQYHRHHLQRSQRFQTPSQSLLVESLLGIVEVGHIQH